MNKVMATPLDAALLRDDRADLEYPYVIKLDGTLASDPAAFILKKYGAALSWRRAEPHPDGKYIFRLVGFKETQGNALLMAFCIDGATQAPLPGRTAIRWWPDAPPLPGEILPPASDWVDNGIIAYTKEDGSVDWAVGHGEAYFPDTGSGVCKVFICATGGPCDLLENWGWLDGTQYLHLAPIFERFEPEPDPGDELARIVAAVEKIAAHFT